MLLLHISKGRRLCLQSPAADELPTGTSYEDVIYTAKMFEDCWFRRQKYMVFHFISFLLLHYTCQVI